jgi:hypothetical protein
MTEADVLSLAEVARPTAPRTGRRAHLLWISLMRSMHARSLGFCRRVTWLAYACRGKNFAYWGSRRPASTLRRRHARARERYGAREGPLLLLRAGDHDQANRHSVHAALRRARGRLRLDEPLLVFRPYCHHDLVRRKSRERVPDRELDVRFPGDSLHRHARKLLGCTLGHALRVGKCALVVRTGFRSRRAAAASVRRASQRPRSEAPETASFVEKKQSRPALLLVVQTSREPDVVADFRFGGRGAVINGTVDDFSPTNGRK